MSGVTVLLMHGWLSMVFGILVYHNFHGSGSGECVWYQSSRCYVTQSFHYDDDDDDEQDDDEDETGTD